MAERKASKATGRRKPKVPTPKPRMPKRAEHSRRVDPSAVVLVETKGSPGKGGDEGGRAWTIMADGARAGTTFINLIDAPPLGPHASIQIYLNQSNQGRGIGRVAYRKAAELSGLDEVYAHMRKINVGSRRAAEEAGFVDATPAGFRQLIMRWRRVS